MNNTRTINIRLTETDLHRLKARAIEEGLPHQTLASLILHKAASLYAQEQKIPESMPVRQSSGSWTGVLRQPNANKG